MSKTTQALGALGVFLLSAEAGASLYEIQSSGLAPESYLSSSGNVAAGQFDAAGVLPVGALIRRATVQFAFQDEPDGLRLLYENSHPEMGDYVEVDPIYIGLDVHYRHVRPYYHVSNSLWRYERESVDVVLNGVSMGMATPAQTLSNVRTETPTGTWIYDHGGSHERYVGLDDSGNPIFGTSYIEYYNDIINVNVTRIEGNQENFSLSGLLDSALYPRLMAGDSLSFSLDALSGDALFKSAVISIETYDGADVPEPSSIFLLSSGLLGIGAVNRRRVPVIGIRPTGKAEKGEGGGVSFR